jgi:hypothetical protein
MYPSACFFTVCGGGDDYEFLLGAIEHHAEMGRHLVLDTTPPERAVRFSRLPKSVVWIHEPRYGHGWKDFRLKTAVGRAMNLAQELKTDVLIYLDSDEFYTPDSPAALFPLAVDTMLEVNYVHWKRDGYPYVFGETEWHPKIWPSSSGVEIVNNTFWPQHPHYNGNPEHHATVKAPPGMARIRVPGNFRHHLHYAVGQKCDETAKTTIAGWPDGGVRVPPILWPEKLALWRDTGIRPSESFR